MQHDLTAAPPARRQEAARCDLCLRQILAQLPGEWTEGYRRHIELDPPRSSGFVLHRTVTKIEFRDRHTSWSESQTGEITRQAAQYDFVAAHAVVFSVGTGASSTFSG